MEADLVQRIKNNSNYQKLVAVRSFYGWTMTAIVLFVFYGYILLVAFDKPLLATKIGTGVTTWGIPMGIFVILFTVIITGIYVLRANKEFDPLTEQIRKEVL